MSLIKTLFNLYLFSYFLFEKLQVDRIEEAGGEKKEEEEKKKRRKREKEVVQ